MFHSMTTSAASIRELRTDFRLVKRKIEQHGEITITDNGEPAYIMKPVARREKKRTPMPDYYARVILRQPQAMEEKATRRFHEENRGDC